MTNHDTTLTPNEAVLLQQLHELGEEDATSLSKMLGFSRHYTAALIDRLTQKGLITINHDIDGLWIRSTNKGKQLLTYLWPEARQFAI